MVQTTANSLSAGGQGQVGGQLLQELEALNQALYQAGQQQSLGGQHGNVSKRQSRRESMAARVESELEGDRETLAGLLRSSHPKPPVRAKSGVDAGKKGENLVAERNEFEDDEVSDDNGDFRPKLEVGDKKKGL